MIKKYLGIWLYGLSGSGKSFIAKSLKKKLTIVYWSMVMK